MRDIKGYKVITLYVQRVSLKLAGHRWREFHCINEFVPTTLLQADYYKKHFYRQSQWKIRLTFLWCRKIETPLMMGAKLVRSLFNSVLK